MVYLLYFSGFARPESLKNTNKTTNHLTSAYHMSDHYCTFLSNTYG